MEKRKDSGPGYIRVATPNDQSGPSAGNPIAAAKGKPKFRQSGSTKLDTTKLVKMLIICCAVCVCLSLLQKNAWILLTPKEKT